MLKGKKGIKDLIDTNDRMLKKEGCRKKMKMQEDVNIKAQTS